MCRLAVPADCACHPSIHPLSCTLTNLPNPTLQQYDYSIIPRIAIACVMIVFAIASAVFAFTHFVETKEVRTLRLALIRLLLVP